MTTYSFNIIPSASNRPRKKISGACDQDRSMNARVCLLHSQPHGQASQKYSILLLVDHPHLRQVPDMAVLFAT